MGLGTRRTNMSRRNTGFTLIELMIVVAIIAILAAIAYPVYTNYIQQSRRSDAQSDLVELANFMERHYSKSGSYASATLPFNKTPRGATGSDVYYDITLNVPDSGQAYTLIATPANAQTGDECGVLKLTQTGQRGAAQSNCW